MRRLTYLVALTALASCGVADGPRPASHSKNIEVSPAAELVIAESEELTDGDLGRVCRAAVASTMGRDVAIIRLDSLADGIAYVSYNRPSDGTVWKTRCKVEGHRLIWSTVDGDGPGSGPGRWRTDPADSVVTFKLREPGTVIITEIHSDGSGGPTEIEVD